MVRKIVHSRVTSKSQTVIPREIREKLGLGPGDTVNYIETDQGILIEKARVVEDDPFSTFTEWASEADDRAYGDL